ncbi:MAG: RNA-binding protein [Bacteroidales bacterium]|nr:RNA-binding protein [Bacteroidales bacterium]
MNIYISNLNFSVNDGGLQALFAAYGEVTSAKVIMDKFTGRSKGFGFVEMPDADAENAIKELNQTEHEGKVINVAEARPREERPAFENKRNFRSNNSGGGYKKDYNNNKRW